MSIIFHARSERDNMELWKQGAEAKIHKTDFYGKPCIVKERFSKSYRHPILDKSLTAQRVKSEIRAMLRCRMSGMTLIVVCYSKCSISLVHFKEESENFLTVVLSEDSVEITMNEF